MKKTPSRSLCFFLFLLSAEANASEPFLEPFVHGFYGLLRTSTTNGLGNTTTASEASLGGGGGIRIGLENEGLFAALEGDATFWSVNGESNLLSSFGISVGGSFVYVPARLWLSFDPIFTSSLSGLDSSPFAARIGLTYYMNMNLTLGFMITHFESSGSSVTGSTTTQSTNTVGLILTLPFNIESPKEPWRTRYEKIQPKDDGDEDIQEQPTPSQAEIPPPTPTPTPTPTLESPPEAEAPTETTTPPETTPPTEAMPSPSPEPSPTSSPIPAVEENIQMEPTPP